MSNCCVPAANGTDCCTVPGVQETCVSRAETMDCPVCGKRGKAVATQTVKAMLAVSLVAIRPAGYRFCRTADCPVVYFSGDGQQTLREAELRERVHQKHLDDDDVFVCYCFRHTPGSIRAELLESGVGVPHTAVDHINAGIQAGRCACELRNPQGSCCLGNVRAVVKRVTQESQPAPVT